MLILMAMFLLGVLLGFIGAGGAGVVIALLTAVFGIPIHLALGTSLGAMTFTTLSGAISHFREGNVVLKIGGSVGTFGAAGAFLGAKISASLPAEDLHWLTAGMLFFSAGLIYWKVFHPNARIFVLLSDKKLEQGARFWGTACLVGVGTGLLSGTFGVGATPFIQICLLIFFGISLHQAVGTTMLVILPMAVFGGIGYMTSGYMDAHLFLQVVVGLMCGAYIGAKFTKKLPSIVLKTAMVIIPVIGGVLLILPQM